MAKLSVAERLERIAQRKLKDEQLEARLRLIQKKADSRSAAEMGRLAAKAGLGQLSPAALFGCFLQAVAQAGDAAQVAAWEELGATALSPTDQTDRRVVAVAHFAAKPPADVVTALRQHGFRWNRILDQFEGRVIFAAAAAAAAVVTNAGGTITRVGGDQDTEVPDLAAIDRPTPLA